MGFLSRLSTMSKLARIPTQDFDRDVTAVAMDDRFILVGQVDGKLSAVYHKNGVAVFSAKISDSEITAVCCEEQDETDNPIFYAGDIEGNRYTVNKTGKERSILLSTAISTQSMPIQAAEVQASPTQLLTSGRETSPLPALTTPLTETVPSTRRRELGITTSSSMMPGLLPKLLQLVP